MQVDDQVVDDAAGGAAQHSVYCAWPGPIRPGRWSASRSPAPRPRDRGRSPCRGGRRRRARRLADRGVLGEHAPPAYSIGIDQPPKSASLAPAASCRSCRGEVAGHASATLPARIRSGRAADDHRPDRPLEKIPGTPSSSAWARGPTARCPRRAPRRWTGCSAAGCCPRSPTSAPAAPRRRSPGCPRSASAPSRWSSSPGWVRRAPAAATPPTRSAGPPARPAGRSAVAPGGHPARRRRRCPRPRAAARRRGGRAAGRLRVHEYKSELPADRPAPPSVHGRRPRRRRGRRALARVRAVADAVTLMRDLVNTPPNDLYPAELAARGAAAGDEGRPDGGDAGRERARGRRYGGILAVGGGSVRPPRLVRLSYRGTKAPQGGAGRQGHHLRQRRPVDQAGREHGPHEERHGRRRRRDRDRVPGRRARPAGQGHRHRADRGEPARGTAYRPADVVTFRNGKKAEITNTDAEGRVVLADAIVRAAEDSPDYLLETSTLTGAQLVALGTRTAGVMGSDDLRDAVVAAGRRAARACGRCRCRRSCAAAWTRRWPTSSTPTATGAAACSSPATSWPSSCPPGCRGRTSTSPARRSTPARLGLHPQGRHRRARPHPAGHDRGHIARARGPVAARQSAGTENRV